jgi:DNA-binding ferritin-like protein
MYGKFIGNLLHSATVVHFMHLQVEGEGSNARHMALFTYYDEIVDLVDKVAETTQGCYGELIRDYPSTFTVPTLEPLEYMLSFKDYVKSARLDMPQDSNIQNEIDNIATLIDSTLYKLTFLR